MAAVLAPTPSDPLGAPGVVPAVSYHTATSVLEFKNNGDGTFEINEIPADVHIIPAAEFAQGKGFGIPIPDIPGLKVNGSVDIGSETIRIYTTWLGKKVGPDLSASLKTGVTLSINLLLVKGSLRVYKGGNEIKCDYDVKVLGAGEKKGTINLLQV